MLNNSPALHLQCRTLMLLEGWSSKVAAISAYFSFTETDIRYAVISLDGAVDGVTWGTTVQR